jgi:hypothetical protein
MLHLRDLKVPVVSSLDRHLVARNFPTLRWLHISSGRQTNTCEARANGSGVTLLIFTDTCSEKVLVYQRTATSKSAAVMIMPCTSVN